MTTCIETGAIYTQTWDAENRLSTMTVNGQTTTFTYDGDGQRVKEVEYRNVTAGISATSSGTLNWPAVVTNGDTWADSGASSSGEYAYTDQWYDACQVHGHYRSARKATLSRKDRLRHESRLSPTIRALRWTSMVQLRRQRPRQTNCASCAK